MMDSNIFKEISEANSKLVKGYEILGELPEVEIGETAKTEIYAEDNTCTYCLRFSKHL